MLFCDIIPESRQNMKKLSRVHRVCTIWTGNHLQGVELERVQKKHIVMQQISRRYMVCSANTFSLYSLHWLGYASGVQKSFFVLSLVLVKVLLLATFSTGYGVLFGISRKCKSCNVLLLVWNFQEASQSLVRVSRRVTIRGRVSRFAACL